LLFPKTIYGQNPEALSFDKIKDFVLTFVNPKIKPKAENFETSTDKERILKYFDTQKPYVIPTFSLHTISRDLNIPHLRVSKCFNNELNTSFPEFRNRKRVEHAIQLFHKNLHFQMSIEGIAVQSGFKNKSSFYAAFRAIHQMTPSEWIKKNTK